MLKKFLQHNNTQKFIGWLIAFYIKVCFNTSLWYLKNENEILSKLKNKKKIIVIFWHNRLLMTSFCWNYENNFRMLISSHRDGQIISNAVSHLGIGTIQGSSSKNKMSSLKEILKSVIFSVSIITSRCKIFSLVNKFASRENGSASLPGWPSLGGLEEFGVRTPINAKLQMQL